MSSNHREGELAKVHVQDFTLPSPNMAGKSILVLPGDGVGPEVIVEALKVLCVIEEHINIGFNIETDLFGGCSIYTRDGHRDCVGKGEISGCSTRWRSWRPKMVRQLFLLLLLQIFDEPMIE